MRIPRWRYWLAGGGVAGVIGLVTFYAATHNMTREGWWFLLLTVVLAAFAIVVLASAVNLSRAQSGTVVIAPAVVWAAVLVLTIVNNTPLTVSDARAEQEAADTSYTSYMVVEACQIVEGGGTLTIDRHAGGGCVVRIDITRAYLNVYFGHGMNMSGLLAAGGTEYHVNSPSGGKLWVYFYDPKHRGAAWRLPPPPSWDGVFILKATYWQPA